MADPLSIAASAAGLVSIADTIFTRIYRYAKGVKGAAKEIEELAAGIRTLSEILHGLQLVLSQYDDDLSDSNLRLHHLNSCRETLLKIQRKIDSNDSQISNRSKFEVTIQKLKWPFSGAEVKALLSEVERHKATINVAMTGDSLATILRGLSRQDRMAEDIRSLRESQEGRWAMETHIAITKQRKKILEFFGKVDHVAAQRTNLKLHHPLTGLWLTEGVAFKTWLHTANSKMWLSGIPGAGKTVLAACAIEEAMKESSVTRAVAYFYCDYKEVVTQDPVIILSSLATQLARQREDAFAILQELYKTCNSEDGRISTPELSAIVKCVSLQASTFQDVSIIVDGLDECGSSTSDVIISLTSLCSNAGSNFRSLFLSRDEFEIRELLQEQYNIVAISAHKEDLELYVAAEIESRQRKLGRGQLRIRSPELKDHIIKTLVDCAEGMFHWVACQLDLLSELPNDAAKRKALSSLPPTLFKTYERILERVNACDYSIQIMVQKALQLTVHCSSAEIDAVCEAISVRDNDTFLDQESLCEKEDILMHCSSLLRISSSEDKFELAHFTVKEFLVGLSPSSNPSYAPYSQMKSYVHPILARTCLTYLRLDPFRGRVLEDLDEWHQQQAQYPFRTHAVRSWVKYAKHAWEDDTVQTLAHDIFNLPKSPHFLSWIRDYIYVGSSDLVFIEGVEIERKIFRAATEVTCFGSITPLHIAAAIGSLHLCQWLIGLGCSINQMSSVGTPLHCVLLGIKRIASIVNEVSGMAGDEEWLWDVENSVMKQGRAKVLDLLIGLGADVALPYRTHDGSEYSCIWLTLRTGISMGGEHPLLKLVTAGAKLEDGFATYFMEDFKQYNTQDSAKTTIETLISQLDINPQTETVRSELFSIALQFQSSVGSESFTSDVMSVDMLYEAFKSAIRFDQNNIVEKLLLDSRLDPLARQGNLGETALHEAAIHDAVNTIDLLLSLGLDIDATNRNGFTALHCAVAKISNTGHVVSSLLSYGASTTITDNTGRTAWHVAAKAGNVIGLEALILLDKMKRSAQSTPAKDGFIPIFLAAKEMHASAFESLLFDTENLEDLPKACPDGLGVVHYAASLNSIKALRFLLDRGEQLDRKTSNGKTALHLIPGYADPEVIHFLMDAGLKASMVTDDGSTPLHAVVETEEYIEQNLFDILATEETIELPNNRGLRVLHCTVSSTKNKKDLKNIYYRLRQRGFEILVRKGADVHATDPTGKSCLQMAFELRDKEVHLHHNVASANLRGFIKLVTTIIESTTDLEILNALVKVDTRSVRLINWAIEIAEEPLVNSLYSKGVDITLQNSGSGLGSTWSALETACYHNCATAIFHRLLERSLRLQGLNKEGHSLVHLACMKQQVTDITILEYLHDSGWDFDSGTAEQSRTPLMLASMAGKKEHVRFLLQRGTEFCSKDKFGWEAVHYAVSSGHLPVLKELVAFSIDWKPSLLDFYAGSHRFTRSNILHLAAANTTGKDLAEFIIENNLARDINCLTDNRYSPLHLAAGLGRCETVTFLLLKGANIEQEGAGRVRPIHFAVIENKLDNVKRLLSHGCLLVADEAGMTPQMYAAQKGFQTIADRLREYEQDNLNSWSSTKGVHSQDQSTVKGLSFAIKLNDLAFCKRVVVEAGVQIPKHLNICGGCNPILVALDNNNLEIAHYLAQCGASTAGQLCSMSKHRGYSAVHLASRHPSNNELLKLLLEKDLEVGSPSFQSPVNPIHVAASYKNAIGLRTLLQHAYDQRWISKSKSQQERLNQSEAILTTNHQLIRKETFYPFWGSHSLCDARMYNSHSKWIWELGSFKARDVQNLTALHISAWLNDNESIGILLDYGAAVDPLDGGYQTPMMAAALCRHLDIVKLLLQHGANPNMIRRDCRNIAIMAVQVGHVEMLKTLVSHGISLTHCDQWGGSVLHYAGRHCPEAFSLLLASGCDPYQRDIDGYTPIEVAIRWRTVRPLCLNSNLDFNRGIIHIGDIGTSLERGYTPLSIMKLLFKRLPASRISREINAIPSRGFLKETMLVTAARRGDQQALDFLIKMGAELELEGSSFGTPLLAACNRGVLSSVRYLIRRGANIFSCKNGEEQSAVQAAKLFPEIIQWLLAERHTEQPKLCWLPAASTEQELSSWSGPMTVEVPIDGLYSPTGGASSFERAKDLAELRKYLQGRVVRLHSNAW